MSVSLPHLWAKRASKSPASGCLCGGSFVVTRSPWPVQSWSSCFTVSCFWASFLPLLILRRLTALLPLHRRRGCACSTKAGLHPMCAATTSTVDQKLYKRVFTPNCEQNKIPLSFFTKGTPYKFLGLFDTSFGYLVPRTQRTSFSCWAQTAWDETCTAGLSMGRAFRYPSD